VVYGDIGTSPLYAFRECFQSSHHLALSPENILGVLSLIFWSLILVISVKYLLFVLHADNRGEGGILALMALVLPEVPREKKWEVGLVVSFGLFGSALLYGDGMITPAISVLSAMEGLEFATPIFEPYVLPITILVLIALFWVQSRGTERVSRLFTPIVLLWFSSLAALGIAALVQNPSVLVALHPGYGYQFFLHNSWRGFAALGAIFLVVTGGEALYADMGHFGAQPIRLSWFVVVLPALLLNYFGQGALLIQNPAAIDNPFYRLVPSWGLYPMILLATLATVVASQAVISGAFSLTRQAVQLGYCPRVKITHTSKEQVGQIYIPLVNWVLAGTTILLVVTFGSSSALSGAYGIAVSTTMVITTVLAYLVTRRVWGWRFPLSLAMLLLFLPIDLAFFGANIAKIWEGGWVPLLIAAFCFLLMSTWMRGREILGARIRSHTVPLQEFLAMIEDDQPPRVQGTAVFMTSSPEGTPLALAKNYHHNRVVHQRVILLTINTAEDSPHVASEDRIEATPLAKGYLRLIAHYGFMDEPSLSEIFRCCAAVSIPIDLSETTFFLGREVLHTKGGNAMASWRQDLFEILSRNASRATDFFDIPRGQVVELGTTIEF
jgi:KUP system potassium uptake protein